MLKLSRFLNNKYLSIYFTATNPVKIRSKPIVGESQKGNFTDAPRLPHKFELSQLRKTCPTNHNIIGEALFAYRNLKQKKRPKIYRKTPAVIKGTEVIYFQ